MPYSEIYILLACLFGLLMTWSVGANDLANVMSTTLGSKAVSIRQAMLIAIVFEFAGAFLGSKNVSSTIQSGIICGDFLQHSPTLLIYGMLASLVGSTAWMLTASVLGLPVSITNAIVGSVVGFGVIVFGMHGICWGQVGSIALTWVLSPTIAGIVSYALFVSVQRLIFDTNNPFRQARRYLPLYLFFVGIILGNIIIIKGLHHWQITCSVLTTLLIHLASGLTIMLIGYHGILKLKIDKAKEAEDRFYNIEQMFAILTAFTACAMVFAHGSNDVAIAVGPMSAIVSTVEYEQHHPIMQVFSFHSLLVPIGCIGVLLGLFMYGRKVIATVGSGITALTPSRAFAATLAAATTVVVSTSTGVPVSATQTLVGAVLGVGLARGIGALNLAVVRNIFMSWIFTIPAACSLTMVFYSLFYYLFSS